MVHTIPADPRLNTGERVVWDRLLAQCGPEDLLVSGQRVTDHVKDFEVDVVLALADGGIVTVEVKGGGVTHDGTSWRQHHGPIHPVEQVRDAKYALRDYVESDPRWGTRGRVRWAHQIGRAHV